MNDNQDHLNLLRKINSKPGYSQRKLADDLKFSFPKVYLRLIPIDLNSKFRSECKVKFSPLISVVNTLY